MKDTEGGGGGGGGLPAPALVCRKMDICVLVLIVPRCHQSYQNVKTSKGFALSYVNQWSVCQTVATVRLQCTESARKGSTNAYL